MEWKIPLSDLHLEQDDIDSVVDVLRSNWLSMGPVTEKFERTFASFLGVKHAVAVSSGTAALHIAHQVLGVGNGDEVITPSLTFVATANAVLYCGGRPVFADIIGADNFNISPDRIVEKLTPNTKAITVVHYGGYPCDMREIIGIADDRGIPVIEDAAHAIGAKYQGKYCGTIGRIGCFSFFANKNLVTGEGGMIVTNDDALAERMRRLRSHAMTMLTWDRHRGHASGYDVVDMGFNYRIHELSAALGLSRITKLKDQNAQRKRIVAAYRHKLEKIKEIKSPFSTSVRLSSYHIFPVLLPGHISREHVMEGLKRKGIQTSIHYPPIHQFSYYQDRFNIRPGELPLTEFVGKHELTLPLYPGMKPEDITYVVESLDELIDPKDRTGIMHNDA